MLCRRVACIAEGDGYVVVDIADAQDLFHVYGRIDRVDVYLGAKQKLAEAERLIGAVVPAGYEIVKPGARSDENRRMLRAFRWNLRVLSYISLVVGAFPDLQHHLDQRGPAARRDRGAAGDRDVALRYFPASS